MLQRGPTCGVGRALMEERLERAVWGVAVLAVVGSGRPQALEPSGMPVTLLKSSAFSMEM